MPIVKAYSGSLRLKASERVNDEPFYEVTKTVYGETLGELSDNLVEYAVTAARAAQQWMIDNKPEDYRFTEGYWRLLITLPDIMKCQEKTLPENIDSTFDSRVLSFEEIVVIATAHRDAQIRQACTYLQLVRGGPSNIPELPTGSLSGIGDSATLEEMTEFGMNGKDLDAVLEIAVLENRIQSYQARLKYDDRLANFESRANTPHVRLDSDSKPRKKLLGIF